MPALLTQQRMVLAVVRPQVCACPAEIIRQLYCPPSTWTGYCMFVVLPLPSRCNALYLQMPGESGKRRVIHHAIHLFLPMFALLHCRCAYVTTSNQTHLLIVVRTTDAKKCNPRWRLVMNWGNERAQIDPRSSP